MIFRDRRQAGELLSSRLLSYRERKETVVAAIPRGGVVVGRVIADNLGLDLDIILTKKIGHPYSPEYAIGVVNLSREFVDAEIMTRDNIPPSYVKGEIVRIRKILKKRYSDYRGGQSPIDLKDKIVILADDGIATGNTIAAAIRLAREEGASKIVIAVPVAPAHAAEKISKLADEWVCLTEPEDLMAIGEYYESFDQVDDEEVKRLLKDQTRVAPGGLEPPT